METKSFDEIMEEYNHQLLFSKAADEYYRLPRNERPTPKYSGPVVDYTQLGDEVKKTLKYNFNLTESQATIVYNQLYQDKHAYFSDLIASAEEYGQYARDLLDAK